MHSSTHINRSLRQHQNVCGIKQRHQLEKSLGQPHGQTSAPSLGICGIRFAGLSAKRIEAKSM
jgi:hypothetical protein